MKNKLQEALNLYSKYGSFKKASDASGIPKETLRSRGIRARNLLLKPNAIICEDSEFSEIVKLKAEIRSLKTDLRNSEKQELSILDVKEKILKIKNIEVTEPEWVFPPSKKIHGMPGVPFAFWSDWHWAEVIQRSQIGGVDNEYNLEIAHRRAKTLCENTIDLLMNHTVNPKYPGIVLALGGDMFSGNIHEELTKTNEVPIMSAVADLQGVLVHSIKKLQEAFKNVFVVGVTGNHSRTTYKVPAKGRAYENFDWLLYQFLKERLEEYSKNITFLLPDGPDAYFKVYNHRFLLTHGDQFRGGDGMIGHIGPVMRGDQKKRTKQMQIGNDYDTMLHGHFHQYGFNGRVLGNGSLCGYNEYCYSGNFPVENPQQALFLVHPDRGITFNMSVHVENKKFKQKSSWVSIPE